MKSGEGPVSGGLPEEFNQALTVALEEASEEMQAGQHPRTARMLRVVRDQVLSWQEIMIRRLAALNVVTLPQEQRQVLLRMVAAEVVQQSIRETREREQRSANILWSTWQAKLGLIIALITLVLFLAGQIYSLLFGLSHPLIKP